MCSCLVKCQKTAIKVKMNTCMKILFFFTKQIVEQEEFTGDKKEQGLEENIYMLFLSISNFF